ncbi:type II toxin-antitoxin system RelE family toxin [Rhodococcus globerulus]|uniref:type II toxin-antitoxin system RelE family toxin n=1 Tax=Rhodococcus globerulus TaxID=33008 RepID=UPI001F35A133|nr:type II toxin-antitoxin system RelE/ParE family toxin [Rhodococcus globerulus]MCE4267676.1 type II toxin-antitoxin system RelE/ParE family toxin [Rhodococcus globerulus]
MSTSSEPYTLAVARSAARSLKQTLPEKVAAAVYEFITGPLLENPHRVGKALSPPLAPAYSARRGSYRVLYLLDERSRRVTVTAVSHRADAYRT